MAGCITLLVWVRNLAGRGGDLVIIDDPHSEQTAMSSSGFDDAWDWYTGGPSTTSYSRVGV